MQILAGKKLLVTGIANDKSIAYAVAESLHKHGAELAFSYQNERLQSRVEKAAAACGSELCFPLDVQDDQQVKDLFENLSKTWTDGFDGFVHAIAFAPRDEISGSIVDGSTREGFQTTLDISAYSLINMTQAAQPYLRENSSVVTLTFVGSTRFAPGYNTMGVAKAALESSVRYLAGSLGGNGSRVNSVSAGPIRTLAASGLSSFKRLTDYSEQLSLLRRNISQQEVGEACAFLMSDMASGITAQNVTVDAGMSSSLAPLHLME